MEVIKDLIGGQKPATIEVPYNAQVAADGGLLVYKGSVVKQMDFDDIDHGFFFTFGGAATVGEGVCGILNEEVPLAAGNGYLPDDGTYEMVYRKITPCFGSTVVQAEYAQLDAAGSSNLDTGFTGSAAGVTLTGSALITGAAGDHAGGWIYITNGANADYLHYMNQSETSGDTVTLNTALAGALIATDDFVVVLPPCAQKCLFDATYTGIKSEMTYGSHTSAICGLSTWIKAPGIPMQKLSLGKHDGLKVANAKFYHQFTFGGTVTIPNYWHGRVQA